MTQTDWMTLEAEFREEATGAFTTSRTAGSKRWITLDQGRSLLREAQGMLLDALGNLQDATRADRSADALAEYARRAKAYNIRMRVLSQIVNDDRRFGLDPALGKQGDYDDNQGLPEMLPAMAHMTDKAVQTVVDRWTKKVRSEAGF